MDFSRNSGLVLYWEQFYAMLLKRLIHTLRNKVVTIVQLLVPIIFVIISCVILNTIPGEHCQRAVTSFLMRYQVSTDSER